jgi:hypothetical protein
VILIMPNLAYCGTSLWIIRDKKSEFPYSLIGDDLLLLNEYEIDIEM